MPEIKEFLWLTLAPRHRSTFAASLLDYRFRLINFVELFEGTATGVWVYRRQIVRVLLEHNCSVLVFARNETAGVAEPSASDERDYRELRDGLALIDHPDQSAAAPGVRRHPSAAFTRRRETAAVFAFSLATAGWPAHRQGVGALPCYAVVLRSGTKLEPELSCSAYRSYCQPRTSYTNTLEPSSKDRTKPRVASMVVPSSRTSPSRAIGVQPPVPPSLAR